MTRLIEEAVDGAQEQVRLQRAGDDPKADREVTRIPIGVGGLVKARVSAGASSLPVPVKGAPDSDTWETLRTLQ